MLQRMNLNTSNTDLFSSFDIDAALSFVKNTVGSMDDGDYILIPSFCDVHVHFREPGFFYKETMTTGSASAARGGYTAVCPLGRQCPQQTDERHWLPSEAVPTP